MKRPLIIVPSQKGYLSTIICKTQQIFIHFLDYFAYARKAPINFFLSVRPSVRRHEIGSHYMDFRET
jgi:hypothetical protein